MQKKICGALVSFVFAALASAQTGPAITSLSPSSAAPGGPAFTLTVNGTGFAASTVSWNGTVLPTTTVSSSQLTVAVPASLIANAGSASVQVQNLFSSSSNAATFLINSTSSGTLAITSLSPAQAAPGGTAFTLTVNGSGFISGATVYWNASALSTVYVNASQLTASVPATLIATAGTALLNVVNPGGGLSNSVNFAITTTQGSSFTSALRIPDVLDGFGWTTLFVVENLDVVPVSYTFNFWSDTGTALSVPFTNGTPGVLSGTLAVGASYFAQSSGTSPSLLQGWAEAASSGKIAVTVLYRYTASGTPDSEGSVTAKPSGNNIIMPFDDTQGYTTGVALANANPTQPLTVTLTFTAESGAQTTGQVVLPAHGHTAFVLSNQFPATAGIRGSVEFVGSSADLTVLGERFTPSLSFATLTTFP